ncbi:MAG: quinolinate synthase NadA [Bacteroidales bacterium]|jgi:quinolinate synthase|nr:quinolinate synthase NadA [Bacteroidales bacterium]
MKIGKEDILKEGFVNAEIEEGINLRDEILKLKKEKNAVILAHFYQDGEIQDIADHIGDSLQLARVAATTEADIILFAGVHFMAETAKILNPKRTVIIPDLNAGCSLADSCPPDEFEKFVNEHPDHVVVSYVNTTAKIKALTDIICTSSNALEIINDLPKDQKILFGPDRNLGNYIKTQTGREDMVIWDGACHVHEEFSLEAILDLKKQHPNAKVLVHPECEKPIRIIADHIGSTSALLNYSKTDACNEFIIATESGIIHQMKKASPDKLFIPAPPKDSTCGCNDCNFMKVITLKKIYNSLKYELPVIEMEEDLRLQAKRSIDAMLEISDRLKIK